MARKFWPFVLHVVQLSWNGMDEDEIALHVGKTKQEVLKILASDQAKQIYARLEAQTLDTMGQVQAVLQAAAPKLMEEKVRLALSARSEAVRNSATGDLLDRAGHVAVKQLEIRRGDEVEEAYRDKSEDEIRDMISQGFEAIEKGETVH